MTKITKSFADCPPPINAILAVMNSVEYDYELPAVPKKNFDRFMQRESVLRRGLHSDSFTAELMAAYDADFDDWLDSLGTDRRVRDPQTLIDFLRANPQPTRDPERPDKAGARNTFQELRNFLKVLVEHAEYDRQQRERAGRGDFETWRYIDKVPGRLVVRPSNKSSKGARLIAMSLDPLYEPLLQQDIRRFRVCPISKCKRFFWADRMDQEACEDHGALVRKWRKRLNEAYEQMTNLNEKIIKLGHSKHPNGALVKKYLDQKDKLSKIIEKYELAKRRVW